MNALTQLVDALTGLERILTTPIPFSYSVHLWVVCTIYCFLLPFQIWTAFKWLTIPATAILSFIFFGFLVAGEEIENPFGYDKNDLNMDHFCANIVRSELAAITSTPAPDVGVWAFAPMNDRVFSACGVRGEKDELHDAPAPPEEWVRRGEAVMREALAMY
jgi:ion channel-forming bestrophin family protein